MNFNNSIIDWKQVDNVISSSNRILLTTHENPDGDGLGSEVAMYHHLCDEKKDVKIIKARTIFLKFKNFILNFW